MTIIHVVINRVQLWVIVVAGLLVSPFGASGQTRTPTVPRHMPVAPPEWLFPVNPPARPELIHNRVTVVVPDSRLTFRPSQLSDLFSAPDWHPTDHPEMPRVVALGRKPGVYACGYCHLPDGGGRPENASLAGLPTAYIRQQVADIRSGARRTAVPTRLPPKLMSELAAVATDTEIRAAAEYFSKLQPQFRIKVIETDTVPRTYVAGWILAIDTAGPREPIGDRIIEVPEDVEQFEHRDSRTGFVAYVPVGSVKAGKELVTRDGADTTVACSGCHGADLKGAGNVPSVAGRSPSYIMRQLSDIRSGLRAGAAIASMVPVVTPLSMSELIQISAYLATLR